MSEEGQTAANQAAAAAVVAAVTTATNHGERLAVVETQVKDIRTDVAEIKTDVKTLLADRASFRGGTALLGRAAPWVAVAVSAAALLRAS